MLHNNYQLPEKISLAISPTPVQKLERLSEQLSAEIYVKRDDLNGFALGGNKVRKLEFLLQEAQAQGATALISCGALQSNHCRAVAAIAAKFGLACHLILRGTKPKHLQSNLLLDHLFNAEIHYVSDEEYLQRETLFAKIAADISASGGRAYAIPEGASSALGSMGYVDFFRELAEQNLEEFDSIVHATGSGGTQAGLIVGKRLFNLATKIIAVNVCYDQEKTKSLVENLVKEMIEQFSLPFSYEKSDLEVLDGFIGEGYALNTPSELKFIASISALEGILLDPIYTGKAFLGMCETLKQNADYFGKRILFVHSGGAFSNFKYIEEWDGVFN